MAGNIVQGHWLPFNPSQVRNALYGTWLLFRLSLPAIGKTNRPVTLVFGLFVGLSIGEGGLQKTRGAASRFMVKRIDKTMLLFAIGGAFNTLVGYSAILGYAYGLGFSPTAANAAGYVTGLLASYPVNKILVFNDRRSASKSLIPYLTAVAFSYLVNLAVLHIALMAFHLPEFAAQALGVAIYAVVFFIASRYWVFKPKEQTL